MWKRHHMLKAAAYLKLIEPLAKKEALALFYTKTVHFLFNPWVNGTINSTRFPSSFCYYKAYTIRAHTPLFLNKLLAWRAIVQKKRISVRESLRVSSTVNRKHLEPCIQSLQETVRFKQELHYFKNTFTALETPCKNINWCSGKVAHIFMPITITLLESARVRADELQEKLGRIYYNNR